jgi:hypothetical protein
MKKEKMWKNNLVWVVTRGHYEDNRVVAVFATEKQAADYCEERNEMYRNDYFYENHEYESFELDEKEEIYEPALYKNQRPPKPYEKDHSEPVYSTTAEPGWKPFCL